MHITLTITAGPYTGKKLELRPGTSGMIGRASWAELSLPQDIRLSGRHFAVECAPTVCLLRDLKSSNGTFLNGKQVSEGELTHGDQITAGQSVFSVSIAVEEASEDSMPARPLPKTVVGLEPPPIFKPASPSFAPSSVADNGGAPEQVVVEVQAGQAAGRRFVLHPGKSALIGRASWAELSIPNDIGVSGRHCVLECEAGQCRLRDLGSTNGTFLNGSRVQEALLRHGDQILAGQTVFSVRFGGQAAPVTPTLVEGLPAAVVGAKSQAPTAPPTPMPARVVSVERLARKTMLVHEEEAAPASPRDQLLHLLRSAESLFVLLDAARNPKILPLLRASKVEHQSLYEGAQAEQLARWAPYLVRLPATAPLLETLVREAWGRSWGSFLLAAESLAELRQHFRKFLTVKLPDGKEVFFRFYDPRVLRQFLPTCSVEQSADFFGPVRAFLVESHDLDTLLKFKAAPNGVHRETIALWLKKAAVL